MDELQAGNPRLPLYRVIDQTELAYLQTHGSYGSSPSNSGKYFALTLSGAQAFRSHPVNRGRTITETSLPQSIVNRAHRFWDPGAHGAGQSVWFDQGQLAGVYAAMTPPVIV
jgi:hypothetical protein